MMRSHRLVGVTFGELSAWHANGETRLLRGRITDIPESDDKGIPARDGYAVRMLLRRLPPLSLDDEEGVLVVWLGHDQLQDNDQDSQLVRIAMNQVRGVVPLTARARNILAGRLEPFGITLHEPWFEDEFRIHSFGLRVESSTRAGNELVKLFSPDVQEETVSAGLANSVALALAMNDFDGAVPGSREPSSGSGTWVSSAFEWVRPTPYDYGALNHLIDAGGVLKKLHEKNQLAVDEGVLDQFRGIAKSMRDALGDRATLVRILGAEKFAEAASLLQEKAPGAMPAGLSVLVLFLRWREHFHGAGSDIHLKKLSDDLTELQSSVNRADLIAALWLLGFYAGSERVMPLAYASGGASYPWFRGGQLEVAPLREQPQPPQEPLTPAQSMDESGDTVETAPTENAGDVGEKPQPSQKPADPTQPVDDASSGSETRAISGTSSDEGIPGSPESCAGYGSPAAGEVRGALGGLFPENSKGGTAGTSGLNNDRLGVQPYGKRPWVKHRPNTDARRYALREARNEFPSLRGPDLYRIVAKEWFGCKKETVISEFVKELEGPDQNLAGN